MEIKIEWNAWKISDGTVRDVLSKAIDAYHKHLDAVRYYQAGWDIANAEKAIIPNTDKEELDALAEVGIKTNFELMCLLGSNGITKMDLVNIQTPYFDVPALNKNGYGRNQWTQEENPNYSKPIQGIGFDDVYAIDHFFKILPDAHAETSWTDKFLEDYVKACKENEEINNLENAYDTIIKYIAKKYHDIPEVRGSWYNMWKDGCCCGCIQERVTIKRSLATLLLEIDGLDNVEFARKLHIWYNQEAKGNSHMRFYFMQEN